MAKKTKKVLALLLAVSLIVSLGFITAYADYTPKVTVTGTVTNITAPVPVYLFAGGIKIADSSTDASGNVSFGERDKFAGANEINYVISLSATEIKTTVTMTTSEIESTSYHFIGVSPNNTTTFYQSNSIIVFHPTKNGPYILWTHNKSVDITNMNMLTATYVGSANSFTGVTVTSTAGDPGETDNIRYINVPGVSKIKLELSGENVYITFEDTSDWATFAVGTATIKYKEITRTASTTVTPLVEYTNVTVNHIYEDEDSEGVLTVNGALGHSFSEDEGVLVAGSSYTAALAPLAGYAYNWSSPANYTITSLSADESENVIDIYYIKRYQPPNPQYTNVTVNHIYQDEASDGTLTVNGALGHSFSENEGVLVAGSGYTAALDDLTGTGYAFNYSEPVD